MFASFTFQPSTLTSKKVVAINVPQQKSEKEKPCPPAFVWSVL
jgi:hypothetical protein